MKLTVAAKVATAMEASCDEASLRPSDNAETFLAHRGITSSTAISLMAPILIAASVARATVDNVVGDSLGPKGNEIFRPSSAA